MKSAALFLFSFAALLSSKALAGPLDGPRTATTHASQDAQVTKLVTRGRALIAQGQGKEARALLEEADALDGGHLRTRMWLVRALIEMYYLNDALDMTDDLATAGATGPDMDYLYGMAFVFKARQYIAQNVELGMVGMHFTDSIDYLQKATQADPDKYADAYLPLAEAAWSSQQLEIARSAAEKAVEVTKGSAAASFMLGDVAFSQFIVANGDEKLSAEADAHWQVAFDAFQAAAKAETAVGETRDWVRLGSAYKKSGDALVWKSRIEDASQQYARAMGANPSAIAYEQILGSLGQEQFLAALEIGAKECAKRIAAEDPSDATLLWWLGWARFSAKSYDESRTAFEKCYAKWPAYANCLWYVALCQFYRQDKDGATASVIDFQRNDPEGLTAAINGNAPLHLSILDGLVGHCFNSGRLVDAARLSAAQGNAAPETTRYWNNVGLFYRDAGDNMKRQKDVEFDPELQKKYYEKALEGYELALATEPENPALLNDTAVVLHYNLDRDLERAKSMYKLSSERAVIELERTDLSKDDRSLYEIALRDSRNNLKSLESLLKKRAEAASKKKAEEKEKPEDEGR